MNSLLKILRENCPSQYDKFKYLKSQAKDILPKIRTIFPEFNNHDVKHAETVMDLLDELIPNDIKEDLNCVEIFCLLSATWLHDIGMVPTVDEIKEFETADSERRTVLKAEIRDQHHIRSFNFIRDNDYFNLDKHEKKIIANICRAHRQIDIQKSLRESYRVKSLDVRLQFLGALLRIADECDITSERVSEHFLEESRGDPAFVDHNKKHELIDEVYLDKFCRIIITAVVTSQDDMDIINNAKRKIEEEINAVREIFKENKFNLDSVDIILDQDKWIEKKITLLLADCKERTIDQIVTELEHDFDDIKNNLENLEAKKLVKSFKIDEEENYALVNDFYTFKQIFDFNYGDNTSKNFIDSPFSSRIIETELFPYLMDLYNFTLTDLDEINRRLEILKISPTAVYLGLRGTELFGPNLNISLMQGKYLLDLLILLGFYYDTYRYDMNIENIEAFLKEHVKPLCGEICSNVPDYIEFYDKAQESARKELIDKLSTIVSEENPEESGQHKFNLAVTSKKGEPDFIDMLNAARLTGKPFDITGDRLSSFKLDSDKDIKVTSIRIGAEYPIHHANLGVNEEESIFEDLIFKMTKEQGKIIHSTDSKNLPYKFELVLEYGNIDKENLITNGNFSFELDPTNADVSHYIIWEQFLRKLSSDKNIYLTDPNTGETIFKAEMNVDESVHGSTRWYEVLEKLLYIQNESGTKIRVPEKYDLNDKDLIDVNNTFELFKNNQINVKLNRGLEVHLKKSDIQEILSSKDDDGLFNPISTYYPNYEITILENKVSLGPVHIDIPKFEISNMDELEDIDGKEDSEFIKLIIKPKSEIIRITRI